MSANARLWVCFAVKEEARFFRRRQNEREGIRTILTGIGAKNARAVMEKELADARRKPEAVFTCGFAGGLAEDLAAGDIVYSADENFPFVERLSGSSARRVDFYHANRVIISSDEKRKLRNETAKDAVEMESEVIRTICRQPGIPSATVRVISDTINEDLPLDFNRFLRKDDTINLPKLIGHLAVTPWKVPKVFRFQQTTRMAAKRLSEFLIQLIYDPIQE